MLEGQQERGGDCDVGEGDPLPGQVGGVEQGGVEHGQGGLEVLAGAVGNLENHKEVIGYRQSCKTFMQARHETFLLLPKRRKSATVKYKVAHLGTQGTYKL